MPLCNYCGAAPAIANSHVVPRFLGAYIKRNSPFGYMLNLWKTRPQFDLDKGSYLCATCDNQVFSSWENYFAQNVWLDPLNARSQWGDGRTINFLVSLAYRYAIHFLATSPMTTSRPYSTFFRDLSGKALKVNTEIGRSLFVYPYVQRPITSTCELLPGINHFLNLALHGLSLPPEGDLPNAMLVIIPKISVLFTDRDLGACADNTIRSPTHLSIGATFDPSTQNVGMPLFLSSILNRYVGQGQGHQKQLGLWKRLAYGTDRLLNPNKMCYVANMEDQELLNWQKENCHQ